MSTKFTTNSLATAEHKRRFSEIVGEENVVVNAPLSELLSIGLGGVAEYFVTAKTSQQLIDVAKLAIELRMPYQLVAGGTSCLPSDVGFPGLIINNASSAFFFSEESRQVVVDSGVSNAELVMAAANQSYGGIEFLAAIPGTVGGAVATSAMHDGRTLRNQSLKEVVMFIPDVDGGKTVTIPVEEVPDAPHKKIFSSQGGFQPIILTVRLQLARLSQYEIVERLKQFRTAVNTNNKLTFAHIFPNIIEHRNSIRLPKLPEGLQYSAKRPNELIILSNKKITATVVRGFIEQIAPIVTEPSDSLDVRLTYLGYWPEDNEKYSTNSKSI